MIEMKDEIGEFSMDPILDKVSSVEVCAMTIHSFPHDLMTRPINACMSDWPWKQIAVQEDSCITWLKLNMDDKPSWGFLSTI